MPALPPTGLMGQSGTVYTPLALTPLTGAGGSLRPADSGLFPRYDSSGAGGSNLFAVSDTTQRKRLARELSQVPMPSDLAVRSEVNTRVNPSAAAEPRSALRYPEEGVEPNEPNVAAGSISPQSAMPLVNPTGQTLTPDQDVFSDVLTRLRGTAGGLEQPIPWQLPQQGYEAATGREEQAPPQRPQLRKHPAATGILGSDSSFPITGKLVEYSPEKGLVLHGLAGIGRDQFNTLMASAEKQLKEGKFYEAAEAYREAASQNPSNPLPRMGLSLALFSAGESLGSAQQLHRAVEMFPPLLTSHLEVVNVADANLIQRRLDFLATRLAHSQAGPEPMLYFIAAFLHANLNQTDQAKAYATKLQASAGDDVILANYARFLLTGGATSAPSSQPASQPTTVPADPQAK